MLAYERLGDWGKGLNSSLLIIMLPGSQTELEHHYG